MLWPFFSMTFEGRIVFDYLLVLDR